MDAQGIWSSFHSHLLQMQKKILAGAAGHSYIFSTEKKASTVEVVAPRKMSKEQQWATCCVLLLICPPHLYFSASFLPSTFARFLL